MKHTEAIKRFKKTRHHQAIALELPESVYDDYTKRMEQFLITEREQAYQEGRKAEREENVTVLVHEINTQWEDADHCSCLRHATWKIMGEPSDKEFLARLKGK